jgi:hypothetical protein
MNTSLTPRSAKPLVPSDIDYSRGVLRAAWAAVAARIWNISPAAACAKAFPHDPVASAIITRAAVSGATTGDVNWAGALVGRATGVTTRKCSECTTSGTLSELRPPVEIAAAAAV